MVAVGKAADMASNNPSVRPNAEEGIMYEATRMAQGDDPCRTASWRILVELVSHVP